MKRSYPLKRFLRDSIFNMPPKGLLLLYKNDDDTFSPVFLEGDCILRLNNLVIDIQKEKKFNPFTDIKLTLFENSFMPQKEYKIGEEFQCGLVRLKCVANRGCKDCYFNGIDYCYFVVKRIVGCCNSNDRKDKTDVAFIKVQD